MSQMQVLQSSGFPELRRFAIPQVRIPKTRKMRKLENPDPTNTKMRIPGIPDSAVPKTRNSGFRKFETPKLLNLESPKHRNSAISDSDKNAISKACEILIAGHLYTRSETSLLSKRLHASIVCRTCPASSWTCNRMSRMQVRTYRCESSAALARGSAGTPARQM